MEVVMNKFTALSFLILFSFANISAEDLRISISNKIGNYLNSQITIMNVNSASGTATFDKTTQCLVNTGDGVKIRVSDVDLGGGRYGNYNRFMVEYTNPVQLAGDAYFDVFIGNNSTPIASIPVENTAEGEFKEASSLLNYSLKGNQTIQILWRGHSASLRTVGANESKPFATVEAIRTSSPLTFKFSQGTFSGVEGVHRVKMVWNNQTAAVSAVYFDNTDFSSVNKIENDETCKILVNEGFIIIKSPVLLKKVEIYSLSGILLKQLDLNETEAQISVKKGLYIVKATNEKDCVTTEKLLMYNE